jgi:hypothetical protein
MGTHQYSDLVGPTLDDSQVLWTLFQDDDGMLVRLLTVRLRIDLALLTATTPSKDLLTTHSSHSLFLCFASQISADPSVLLEFLVSAETPFLEYFVRYLRYLDNTAHVFVKVIISKQIGGHDDNVTLEDILDLFESLSVRLSDLEANDLIPFSPGPLLNRLEKVLATLYNTITSGDAHSSESL